MMFELISKILWPWNLSKGQLFIHRQMKIHYTLLSPWNLWFTWFSSSETLDLLPATGIKAPCHSLSYTELPAFMMRTATDQTNCSAVFTLSSTSLLCWFLVRSWGRLRRLLVNISLSLSSSSWHNYAKLPQVSDQLNINHEVMLQECCSSHRTSNCCSLSDSSNYLVPSILSLTQINIVKREIITNCNYFTAAIMHVGLVSF